MENANSFEVDQTMKLHEIPMSMEGAMSLAPGAERHHTSNIPTQNGALPGSSGIITQPPDVSVLNYSTDFPELPDAAVPETQKHVGNAWSKPPAVRSKNVTQVFQLRSEERASFGNGKNFGDSTEEQQKCNEIAKATETSIELCEAKDHSLTVLITGKRGKVEEARSRLVRELQTKNDREISIPKEHHRILIGKEGSKLRQLEHDTDCRIIIPGRDSPSDVIRIVGPREGIEKAIHEIQLVSDKQSKLAQEHLMIPRIFYPWIRGPNNENIDALTAETGAKINIPPPAANNEVIVITGEKEGVHKAADAIRKIHNEKKDIIKPVTCQVARAQHRYVIGPQGRGLADILRQTGVSVEVPHEDEESDTITLRGDPAKLGEALALVYAKASSVISVEIKCPTWMHKFLIGPKGSALQALVPNKDKVQIDFEDGGMIFLEGAPEDVKIAQAALNAEVDRLTKEMCSEVIKVHPSLHRHVIGRGGALITKIKDETGVQITIPNEQTNSDEIKVEGNKEGVKKAIDEILEIVHRIENEKSRDIIIEQRFHKQIIGAKGEAITKLREQYPSVVFSFPDANKKSDIVNLRGDRNEVDKVYKQLAALNKEMLASNFQMTVPIFKEFHKHIIGKGGANVRKIREETQTRIDLPSGESDEDKITVTGKEENVKKAVKELTRIQDELTNIETAEVMIPQKLHARMLGGGSRLIHDIQDECGGVHIKFPPEKSNSDKVTIRGPKDDVARAQKLLMALAKDRELSSFEDSVTAKPEYHKFLIGRGGARIKKIREMYPDVRIMFPRDSDADKETIHLMGREEDVGKVKKELQNEINQLNETVEIKIDVDPKWHRHFVIRGAAVLHEIQEQNGGVTISFPRVGSTDWKVTIKGSKQCVESAKNRIEEIVDDLEAQVTIKVEIPSIHHRALLSNRGQKIQEICANLNVQIKFPDRRLREDTHFHDAEQTHETTEATEEHDGPSPLDLITVSGRNENVERAKYALLGLVPITKIIHVPLEYHRELKGRNGDTVRSLMQAHDVNISIPREGETSDEIKITGTAECVESALTDILDHVQSIKERSHKLSVDVPSEYHVRLIGPKGRVVNELRDRYHVQIAFPRGDEPSDTIVITGREEDCDACKDEILSMVGEVESMFTEEINLSSTYHPRLIGQKGRNLRKVMEQFGVEIRLPRPNDPDPNLVVVAGKNQDNVYDCIDYLRTEEEDFLQERIERGQYMAPKTQEPLPKKHAEVQIQGAPWQLDMQSEDQFPSMGAAQKSANASGVWGGARRF